MTIALVILASTALLFTVWKLIRVRARRTPKNPLEALEDTEYFQQNLRVCELQKKIMAQGTEQDVMPEGTGEFGLEATNPIPTFTTMGNIAYLGKLRTMKGTKVLYERTGPANVTNIPYMIDAYRITGDGQATTIYLCAYNRKNSEKAPKGFRLASIEEAYFGSR